MDATNNTESALTIPEVTVVNVNQDTAETVELALVCNPNQLSSIQVSYTYIST